MILFPNQTMAHPDDVRDRVKEESRRHAGRAGPGGVIEEWSWDLVDQASWESFPASDAPPWTLGYIGPSLLPAEANTQTEGATTKELRP